jgi:CubicO group peptidase (beta-lactamase class C family)
MTSNNQADEVVAPEAVGLDSEALARLRGAIEGDIAAGLHFGAGVIVARGGQIAFRELIGKSDPEKDRTTQISDRYSLASTSKAITAAAVMILVDRAVIGLDTRVADVIPEFGVRGKQRVTVYHLLTHTGGTWPHFMPPYPMQSMSDVADLSQAAAAVSAQTLAHRPGEICVYNPWADFTILGEVINRAAGRSYRDFMKEEVFDPLGMNETTCGLQVDHPDRVPVTVTDLSPGAVEASVLQEMNKLDETAERPGGGIFSTIGDVFKFAEMLRLRGMLNGTRLLSPALVEYALRNHTGDMTNRFWDFSKEARDIAEFPANVSLMGGYVRGDGHYLTPLGQSASSNSFGAVGAGSTMFMVDPQRDLTFVFLSAGLLEGLGHFQRLQRLSDLAIGAVN